MKLYIRANVASAEKEYCFTLTNKYLPMANAHKPGCGDIAKEEKKFDCPCTSVIKAASKEDACEQLADLLYGKDPENRIPVASVRWMSCLKHP